MRTTEGNSASQAGGTMCATFGRTLVRVTRRRCLGGGFAGAMCNPRTAEYFVHSRKDQSWEAKIPHSARLQVRFSDLHKPLTMATSTARKGCILSLPDPRRYKDTRSRFRSAIRAPLLFEDHEPHWKKQVVLFVLLVRALCLAN